MPSLFYLVWHLMYFSMFRESITMCLSVSCVTTESVSNQDGFGNEAIYLYQIVKSFHTEKSRVLDQFDMIKNAML